MEKDGSSFQQLTFETPYTPDVLRILKILAPPGSPIEKVAGALQITAGLLSALSDLKKRIKPVNQVEQKMTES